MTEISVLVVIFMENGFRRAKELGAFSSKASAEDLLQRTMLQHEHHDWTWMEDESAWRFGDLMLRVQSISVKKPIVVGQDCFIAIRLFYDEEAQLSVLGQDIKLKRWHAEVLCASPSPSYVVHQTYEFTQQSEWKAEALMKWERDDGQHIQIFQRKLTD